MPNGYGLHRDGTRRVPLGGGWTAVLQAGAVTAGLSYRGPDGAPSPALPPEVKARGAGQLAALRAEVRTVRAAIARERARIEGLLTARQSWDLVAWRNRCLDHPVTGRLARG